MHFDTSSLPSIFRRRLAKDVHAGFRTPHPDSNHTECMLTWRHSLWVPCRLHCQSVLLESSEHRQCEQTAHHQSVSMHHRSQDKDSMVLLMMTNISDKYDKPTYHQAHTALHSSPSTDHTQSNQPPDQLGHTAHHNSPSTDHIQSNQPPDQLDTRHTITVLAQTTHNQTNLRTSWDTRHTITVLAQPPDQLGHTAHHNSPSTDHIQSNQPPDQLDTRHTITVLAQTTHNQTNIRTSWDTRHTITVLAQTTHNQTHRSVTINRCKRCYEQILIGNCAPSS